MESQPSWPFRRSGIGLGCSDLITSPGGIRCRLHLHALVVTVPEFTLEKEVSTFLSTGAELGWARSRHSSSVTVKFRMGTARCVCLVWTIY